MNPRDELMGFAKQFSSLHLDILKEIGNIGAGHAATSLSLLLNHKVDMHVPAVRLVNFDEVMELAGGSEKEVFGVSFRIEGDAPGSMFFIFSPEQADYIVSSLTGIKKAFESENSLAHSALQELANILSGSYLTALADFTKLDFTLSVPAIAFDMAGAILSYGLLELSQFSDEAILVETVLEDVSDQETEVFETHFFLFPDPQSYTSLFRALGVTNL